MNEKFFSCINKINSVFLLLILICLLGFLCFLVADELITTPQRTAVVQETQEVLEEISEKKVVQGEYLETPRLIEGYYIFPVKPSEEPVGGGGKLSRSSYSRQPVVNMLFVSREGGELRYLFDQPAYIDSFSYADFNGIHKFYKHIFLAALKDRNGDNTLTSADGLSLMISDINGENLKVLSENVLAYDVYESQTLFYTVREGDEDLYFTYDAETQEILHLFTGDRTLSARRFSTP